jgi:hypothetical protein
LNFNRDGIQVIKNFLEIDFIEFIQDYFSLKINSGAYNVEDNQVPHSYEFYSDHLMETILQNSCENLSKEIDLPILPTYSFTRFYTKGDELKIHRDRSECEISATISLGFSEDGPIPPLCFSKSRDSKTPTEILLNPGDLCFYRGCDYWHWRPPIQNKWVLQSFMHFVDANGKNSHLIYDSRNYLGFPSSSKINKT